MTEKDVIKMYSSVLLAIAEREASAEKKNVSLPLDLLFNAVAKKMYPKEDVCFYNLTYLTVIPESLLRITYRSVPDLIELAESLMMSTTPHSKRSMSENAKTAIIICTQCRGR